MAPRGDKNLARFVGNGKIAPLWPLDLAWGLLALIK